MSLPYDLLEAANISYLYDKAMRYVKDIHYDAYNYVDKKKTKFRSLNSRTKIDKEILKSCEFNSKSFISELKSKNLLSMEEHNMIKTLGEGLKNYLKKINKEIDDIISEYS